ncbi:MAG: serine protease, partial [Rhodococcus sp. (in: high G+C Gram-positive bacteria)]
IGMFFKRIDHLSNTQHKLGKTAAATAGAAIFLGSVFLGAPASAITGGFAVPDGKYPFMVQLELREAGGDWKPHCGASLLDDKTLLTAAHCLPGALPGFDYEFRAVFNRVDTNKPGGDIVGLDGIRGFAISPEWESETPAYDPDVGIIKLKEAAPTSSTVRLPTPGVQPTGTATVTGWGWDKAQNDYSTYLQEVDLPIIDPDRCDEPFDETRTTTTRGPALCAGTPDADSGSGDSGGPLFQAEKDGAITQIGIVSGGIEGQPGDYTNLTHPALQAWVNTERAK